MGNWPKITQILNLKEKILFYFLISLLVFSSISWALVFYYSKTESRPNYGGEYIEGIIGQPVRVNPLLAQSNDVDGDISEIIYSGLYKYDGQGKIIPDLAESYELDEEKTTYTIRLKNNVQWHDGEKFNADDVLFTANLISDPAYKSPLRSNWQGIEIQKIDDYTVSFKVKNPYVGFLNNLTFGVLPKHIWEGIMPDNFHLSELNLEPIGTGPYKYSSFQKDSKGNILSYKLISNPAYFEGKPYISKLTFNFYIDETSALDAYNRKEVMGINSLPSQKISDIKIQKSGNIHKFDLPRYYAVFFNQTKSIPIASDEVRQALSLATDRQEIIEKVLNGNGQPALSPFLPGMAGPSDDSQKITFDLTKANEILDTGKWVRGEDGVRTKDNVRLEINLVTTDWEELTQTAEILKNQWEKIGVRVNVTPFSISDIQQNYIRPREYEALLFGQVLGADPDPYSFWHSNQKKDPGLNLSLFGADETDKLIEEGRVEFDAEKRAATYRKFQEELAKETPAVFIYSPEYIYPVAKKVQGIDIQTLISPSKRFSDVDHWYIKTKRIWK